jgi:ribose 5-phosphate isomerase RpiB
MKVVIDADENGLELKKALADFLKEIGLTQLTLTKNFGRRFTLKTQIFKYFLA